MAQHEQSLPAGWRHIALGTVGSTNDEALALAATGETGPLWVTAERQIGGRGRQGRPWVSEPGNLYASALLTDPLLPERLSLLPMATGLALADALGALGLDNAGIGLKWPNDVLVGGAKAAGILIEAHARPDGLRTIIVGCGVNLAHCPTGTPYPATSLAAEGISVTSAAALEALAMSLAHRLSALAANDGKSAIVAAWRARAYGQGRAITVRLPAETLSGRFSGIDEDGLLVLELDTGGIRRISAGDVFF